MDGSRVDEWMEVEDNLEKRENGKLSASDKRILIMQWVGAAWEKLFSDDSYHPDRYFERTGCLLTLDGSEDDKVNIQGLPKYKPPPASVTDLHDELLFSNVQPMTAANEPEIHELDDCFPDDDEHDIEITEADAPLHDDEEYVLLQM